MSTLIFDIETVGEDFDALDRTTQEVLTRWIKKESGNDEEYAVALDDLKDGLGFSPLTGEIVAIGVLDAQKEKGAVYYQAPGEKHEESEEAELPQDLEHSSANAKGVQHRYGEEGNITLKQMSEKEMLEHFWNGAKQYDTFVTFNGRGFDVPFLMLRSAIRGVTPSKDLMSNRYLGSQKFGAKHIDLLDQLSFYGALRRKGNLHLFCRAFGIKSPKADGVSGDDVGRLFKEKRFIDIARYNVGDLLATKALYEKWNEHLRL